MTANPSFALLTTTKRSLASSAMLLEAMGWDVAVWHSGGAFLDEGRSDAPGAWCSILRMPGLSPRSMSRPNSKDEVQTSPFSFSPAAFRWLCMSCATAQSTFSKNPLSR